MKRLAYVLLTVVVVTVLPRAEAEKVDFAAIGKIREEGFTRSQVMDHIFWLADVYGPRLTGSPGIQQASEWAMTRFKEWGLANVHQERWKFGKGWSLVRFSANLVEPQVQPIIGYPQSWSPGTNGLVVADVVRAPIANENDFAKYRGTLTGKIVLAQPARAVRMLEGPIILRMDDKWTAEAMTTPVPEAATGGGRGGNAEFARKLREFYRSEGVVAVFDRGGNSDMAAGGSDLTWAQQHPDGGTIFPGGAGPRDEHAGSGVASVTLAVEHYNRMVRLLDRKIPVKVEINIDTTFIDEATMNGFNTVADLPGTDLASEIVLLGAHLDSHPYATGATDNATGSAAMMEALRILKATGVKPRRTVRVALWGGEEQGLLGSRAYVTRTSRRRRNDDAQAGAREDHRVLQLGQRDRARSRRVDAEQPRRAPDFRAVDRAAHGPGRDDSRSAFRQRDRSRLVRRCRDSGVSVPGRSAGVQLADAPFEHGHGGPRAAGGHGPAGHGHRGVRVRHGHA